MIEKTQLKSILDFITKIIAKQIEDTTNASKATVAGKNLENFQACACGQYIVKGRKQRGVHGTSAAIRVLAGSKDNSFESTINGLINYLLNRHAIDKSDGELSHTNNFQHDNENIIKLSEQLHAIRFAYWGMENTRALFDKLYRQIIDAYKARNNNAWGYFTNSNAREPELLPTAFAVMAIGIHGNCSHIEAGIEILANQIKKALDDEKCIADPATFAIHVFILYVLAFKVNETTREKVISDEELSQAFLKVWNSKFCTLDGHIEQDIDYWNEDDESFNIRIPWQLYLFPIAARFDSKKFCSIKMQRLLKSIYEKILTKKEFKYEYSGNHMSTRTLSIIYETVKEVDKQYNSSLLYKVYTFYDKLKIFLGYPWTRRILYLLMAILLAFLWWRYNPDSLTHLEDLIRDETIMGLLIGALEIGKKHHK